MLRLTPPQNKELRRKMPPKCRAPARRRSVPVHLSGVLLGVNGHGSNPQLSAGSEHADGDLTWAERKVKEGGRVSHLSAMLSAFCHTSAPRFSSRPF